MKFLIPAYLRSIYIVMDAVDVKEELQDVLREGGRREPRQEEPAPNVDLV